MLHECLHAEWGPTLSGVLADRQELRVRRETARLLLPSIARWGRLWRGRTRWRRPRASCRSTSTSCSTGSAGSTPPIAATSTSGRPVWPEPLRDGGARLVARLLNSLTAARVPGARISRRWRRLLDGPARLRSAALPIAAPPSAKPPERHTHATRLVRRGRGSPRRGAGVADRNRLESGRRETYRGFESRPLCMVDSSEAPNQARSGGDGRGGGCVNRRLPDGPVGRGPVRRRLPDPVRGADPRRHLRGGAGRPGARHPRRAPGRWVCSGWSGWRGGCGPG